MLAVRVLAVGALPTPETVGVHQERAHRHLVAAPPAGHHDSGQAIAAAGNPVNPVATPATEDALSARPCCPARDVVARNNH